MNVSIEDEIRQRYDQFSLHLKEAEKNLRDPELEEKQKIELKDKSKN